tara:strand:- start:43338 stop:44669 length:1332 start_codon:yes stop_codon:yes gene_type:complete
MTQTRRRFLKSAAAGVVAGTGIAGSRWPAAAAPRSANEQLNVAFIGVAGRGVRNLDALSPMVNVAALCDVDRQRLAAASANHTSASTWTNFREMLSEQSDIDAVSISTPDHWHACIGIEAMRAGKHVYCEKPLARSIVEARRMAEVAAEEGVVTQMGNQRHADERLRTVVEMVKAGVIGDVDEVHIWSGKGRSFSPGDRPQGSDPVPEWLDWNLWLGPSPERPYVKDAYAHFDWRGWWDFGGGNLGDMGCHLFDCAYWALDLDFPSKITTDGPAPHPESTPAGLACHYEFPARGDKPPVSIMWYDGTKAPPWKTIAGVKNMPPQGTLLIGKKGKILFPHNEPVELIVDGKSIGFDPPAQTIPRVDAVNPNHAEWVHAIRGEAKSLSNFAYAGRLTEVVLAGTVAHRAGQSIDWDGPNMRATNCPAADKFIKPTFRQPWAQTLS